MGLFDFFYQAWRVDSHLKYTWLFGWFGDDRERDIKINIICPATEIHIRKVNEFPSVDIFSHIFVLKTVHATRADNCPWNPGLVQYTREALHRRIPSFQDQMARSLSFCVHNSITRIFTGLRTYWRVSLNRTKFCTHVQTLLSFQIWSGIWRRFHPFTWLPL